MKNRTKIIIAIIVAIITLIVAVLITAKSEDACGLGKMLLCTFIIFLCLIIVDSCSQPKPELIPGKRYHLHDIIEIGKEKIFILSYKEMVLQVEETKVAGFKNIIWLKRLPEIGQDYICFETGELA